MCTSHKIKSKESERCSSIIASTTSMSTLNTVDKISSKIFLFKNRSKKTDFSYFLHYYFKYKRPIGKLSVSLHTQKTSPLYS